MCPLFAYTEIAARHKLERHRRKGDDNVVLRWHEECRAWHVLTRDEAWNA